MKVKGKLKYWLILSVGIIILILILGALAYFIFWNGSNSGARRLTADDSKVGLVSKGLYYYLGNNVQSTDLSACQSSTNGLKSTTFFVDYKNSQYSSLVADARLLYDINYSKEKKNYSYSFNKNETKRVAMTVYGCFDQGLMELYIKSNNTLLFKTEIK